MESNIIYYQTVEKVMESIIVGLWFMGVCWLGLTAWRLYLKYQENKRYSESARELESVWNEISRIKSWIEGTEMSDKVVQKMIDKKRGK